MITLSDDIIAKIKHIELKANYLVTDAMSGEYISAFKGQGMEFDEVREYIPGDDVRTIDWNVTARMQRPFIKKFKEERELSIILAVDVSPSQNFSSSARRKVEIATEMSAIIAYLAKKNNDRVGLLVFSDHVEKFIPPMKGRSHVLRIISEVLGHRGAGQETDINGAVQYLNKVIRKRSTVFLISDFFGEGYDKALSLLVGRNKVMAIDISDPVESTLPNLGLVGFTDPETKESQHFNLWSKKSRQEYNKKLQAFQFYKAEVLRRLKVRNLKLLTTDNSVEKFVEFMRTMGR